LLRHTSIFLILLAGFILAKLHLKFAISITSRKNTILVVYSVRLREGAQARSRATPSLRIPKRLLLPPWLAIAEAVAAGGGLCSFLLPNLNFSIY